ncbi:MAG: HPF/RaiA family ribosome-associated protein [Burkholderiaceae bacterium]|nr:HPF/RaiA family ribosome-associated protein [Burkholderiaceae bacterium]
MQVLFDARDPEGLRLRATAVQRIHQATRRLGRFAPRVRIRLEGVRDARRGLDKRCRVEFAGDRGAAVVVTSTARDWPGALEAAMRCVVRKLMSMVGRVRPAKPARPVLHASGGSHAQLSR